MKNITIIGGGLAGSEAALTLADLGFAVRLVEMRPHRGTPVHHTGYLSELVCSNSLKSTKPDSAAGLIKAELDALGSHVYAAALRHEVAAGGALAVDRAEFSADVTALVEGHPRIDLQRYEAVSVADEASNCDALVLVTGPLTSDALSASLAELTGSDALAFYDAAAPVVMADSLDYEKLFRQSRYEKYDAAAPVVMADSLDYEKLFRQSRYEKADENPGDYLNAPFDRETYDDFIEALLGAERVIAKSFESKDLFQACQPIEEIARAGHDAPRFGTLKPVGLTDPRTGRRPWAALQLRAEDVHGSCYNLVGFQTNLTFPEQRRVFRMIPGLENAEFARYGVMHRNTFVDAPRLLDDHLRLRTAASEELGTPVYVAGQLAGTEGYCEAIRSGLHVADAPRLLDDHLRLRTAASEELGTPVYVAGQLAGTEGYCEAIRSGLHVAFSVAADLRGAYLPSVPREMVFGSLLAYATDPNTVDYQPMHVNFGILPPLEIRIRNKKEHSKQKRALPGVCG